MSILDTIIAVYNSEFIVINSRKHFMNLMRGKIGNIKTKKFPVLYIQFGIVKKQIV